jgi:hypothetical protein
VRTRWTSAASASFSGRYLLSMRRRGRLASFTVPRLTVRLADTARSSGMLSGENDDSAEAHPALVVVRDGSGVKSR